MKKNILYGAILGDLAGQPYEFPAMTFFPLIEDINLHNPDSFITDDTYMTLATAKAILDNQSFEEAYKEIGNMYQGDHYAKGFKEWLASPLGTINPSWGNGCLMRISPIMYLNLSYDEKIMMVLESCLTSHAHPISVFNSIELCEVYFNRGRNSSRKFDFIFKPFEKFEVKADATFEFCHMTFLANQLTHNALRQAISCGGDTDTNASIIGELMSYTHQDLTQEDISYVESKLDPFLLDILHRFNNFINPN